VQDAVDDKMMKVKLAFFETISSQMTPFLTMFQSECPLVPFLSSRIEKLVRALMVRFVKGSVLKDATNVANLLKIDVEKSKNQVQLRCTVRFQS
jgi:hypothetical protein